MCSGGVGEGGIVDNQLAEDRLFLVTAEDMLLRWPYKCYSSLSMIIADC